MGAVAAAIGGLLLGSFLNVVIYRLPRGESLISPGSHCPGCGVPIKPYDNIPVLGWLLLRGRCRACKEPISIRYPLVEALTASGGFDKLRSSDCGVLVFRKSPPKHRLRVFPSTEFIY